MEKLTCEEYLKLLDQRAQEVRERQASCPYQNLAYDFFARFHRDWSLQCGEDETEVTEDWRIVYDDDTPVVALMAERLAEFFTRCMEVPLTAQRVTAPESSTAPAIALLVSGKGEPESFTIAAGTGKITVMGADAAGVRNGVVRLIGLLGFRMAPFFPRSEVSYTPRLTVRDVGLGGVENDVFYGSNAALIGVHELYELSVSDAIPALTVRRKPDVLAELVKRGETAQKYALKSYIRLTTTMKFKEDDPLFAQHPEIRGTRTWSADGDFIPCTQSPLFKQYLTESIEGLFRMIPGLSGIIVIIGGEGFYHCYMHSYGAEWGDTTCPRCKPLGAEQTVADLCNLLAEAAQRVNPDAEVIAWPYSAMWSKDPYQLDFIRHLHPGVSIMTEMEKDEKLYKPGGVMKRMWDYSIDMIGPGNRAKAQLSSGVPVHALTMAEMSFEAPLLPMIPVPGRWARRSEAIASSGARGVYMWTMSPFHGVSTGELYQYKWFSPVLSDEEILHGMARRTTGNDKAADLLEQAWREVDYGFDYMPFTYTYYKGPQYLGPAQPLVLDDDEEIPEVFKGYFCFLMEANLEAALEPLPTYEPLAYTRTHPEGDSAVIETYFRVVQSHLERAVKALDAAQPSVLPACQDVYEAETFPIRWFYHTVRTCGNMFEAGRVRDALREETTRKEALRLATRLGELLQDELQNTLEALPISEKDTRLETLHRGDHSFSRLSEMLEAKIALTEKQIREKLPVLMEEAGQLADE